MPELRRAGIDALVKALGPVGMARFLQQFDPGRGDYTIERDRILGTPTVDELMDEIEGRRKNPPVSSVAGSFQPSSAAS